MRHRLSIHMPDPRQRRINPRRNPRARPNMFIHDPSRRALPVNIRSRGDRPVPRPLICCRFAAVEDPGAGSNSGARADGDDVL